MGYLKVQGKVMTYNEYQKYKDRYKAHGIQQFLKIYSAHKDK